MQLLVRTRAPVSRMSGAAERITLKFGVWLWDQQPWVYWYYEWITLHVRFFILSDRWPL